MDACMPSYIPVSFATSTILSGENYITKRTWTASDICGNQSVHTQFITSTTTSSTTAKPIINNVPANVIIAWGSPIPAISPAVTATSGTCSKVTLTLSEKYYSGFNCPQGVDYIICTWTAKDAYGNITIANWTITYSTTGTAARTQQQANNQAVAIEKLQINSPSEILNTTSNSQNVTLFPNPTTGEVMLNFNGVKVSKVEMYDVTGRQILSSDNNGNDNLQLDLTAAQKGVYHVKVYTESGIVTKRLLLMD
jgi:hypothetical protein